MTEKIMLVRGLNSFYSLWLKISVKNSVATLLSLHRLKWP